MLLAICRIDASFLRKPNPHSSLPAVNPDHVDRNPGLETSLEGFSGTPPSGRSPALVGIALRRTLRLSRNPPARSAWHERQRGRETPTGEGDILAAVTEGLSRSPEGAHEFHVDRKEHLASGFRRRVNERGGGVRAIESGQVSGPWASRTGDRVLRKGSQETTHSQWTCKTR